MATVLKFSDGDDGSRGCIGCYIADQQMAEFRAVMRRLLDSEGPEAAEAIEAAEKLLDGYDTIDREDEDERERERHWKATHCDCGTFKGSETSYCPECDAETLARLSAQPQPPSHTS